MTSKARTSVPLQPNPDSIVETIKIGNTQLILCDDFCRDVDLDANPIFISMRVQGHPLCHGKIVCVPSEEISRTKEIEAG